MYCRKCGTQLPEESAFCHRCGTKIVSESEAQQDFTDAQRSTGPRDKKMKSVAYKKFSKLPDYQKFLLFLGGLVITGFIIFALISFTWLALFIIGLVGGGTLYLLYKAGRIHRKPIIQKLSIGLMSVAGIIAIVFVITAVIGGGNGTADNSTPKLNQLSGTYADTLGLYKYTFNGNNVEVTMFGIYWGEAKYKIDGNQLTIYNLDLFSVGYTTDGNTTFNYRKDGDSIYLDDYRLRKQ